MKTPAQVKPTTLKSTLMSMAIGDTITFPIEKRGSVRTTISYMKELTNVMFKTNRRDSVIIVERKA